MPKIIGIGMPRTGNQTLQEALEALGYSTHLGCRDLEKIAEPDATIEVTLPIADIDARYPDSKYIFTIRDRESWLASCRRMLKENVPQHDWPDFWRLDPSKWAEAYDDRIFEASTTVGNKCLFYSVLDGWKPLTDFLGIRKPDKPFPHMDRWRQWDQQVKLAISMADDWMAPVRDSQEIRDQEGYSSLRIRYFLNALCMRFDSVYLEVGCYKGATLAAALYNNSEAIRGAYAVDDWSWGNNKGVCKHLLQQTGSTATFIEQDFRTVTREQFERRPNILMVDLGHNYQAVMDCLEHYWDITTLEFVLILNHWNIQPIQDAWIDFVKKHNPHVTHQWILTTADLEDCEHWYSGLFVAIIRK